MCQWTQQEIDPFTGGSVIFDYGLDYGYFDQKLWFKVKLP